MTTIEFPSASVSRTKLSPSYLAKDRLPPSGEYVLIRTASYQVIAYMEPHGVWRLLNGKKEENTVISWQPL